MSIFKINWFRTSVLIFILSAILYLLFLILLRYDLKPNTLLFLIPTISMIVSICYQIFRHTNSEKIILFEILLFALLLHFMHVIPCMAGVFGDDFPQYYYSTKLVMDYGYPIPDYVLSTPQYEVLSNSIRVLSNYPTLVMNGGITWTVTGLDPIIVCRWLPSIWTVIGILAIYIFSKSIFNDKRAALLAILGFSTISWSIAFHSQYVRETIAFVIFMFAAYAFLSVYKRNKRNLTGPAILFAISLVLAHYYVSIIWIAFLIIFALCSKFIDYFFNREQDFSSILQPNREIWYYIFFAIIIAFAYWIYVETSVMGSLVRGAERITLYGSTTIPFSITAQPYLKDELIGYLDRFLLTSFCIVLLLEVIRGIKGSCRYLKEDFFIATWVAIFLIILPFSKLLASPQILNPHRVIFFAFFVMIIGITHSASNNKKKKIRNAIMILIVLFTIVNLFKLPIVPQNFMDMPERNEIMIMGNETIVNTGYHMPQDLQGIAASNFYQDAEDADFVRWFLVKNKKLFAKANEMDERILYDARPYTKEYLIVPSDSYLNRDRLYHNGKVEIIK